MRILSLAPLAGPALDDLRALGDLELDPWNAHVPIRLHSAEELISRLDGVDVFVVEADHVPAAVIEATSLRAIASCRGDPVNIDIAAATARGIPLVRAPGRNARGVAELALGLAIALARGIVSADDDIRAGRWVVDERIAQQRYTGREIRSLTVGLVGFGAVGREAGALFAALGARVLAFDPHVADDDVRSAGAEPRGLDALLAEADVVSIHAALADQTRGLIGAREIRLMKSGALLVNTARYEIVDDAALLEALRSGAIAGAAFDHFHHEFLPSDHPLTAMPNVILTPHIGGTTLETVETHTRIVADGLRAVLAGRQTPSLANPEVLAARRG